LHIRLENLLKPYYEDEYCKLFCGDCLNIMEELAIDNIKFDAIITDPPYGKTASEWDKAIPFIKMWNSLNKIIKNTSIIALFGIEPFSSFLRTSNIKNYKYDWYWYKNNPTGITFAKTQPMRCIENISIFYKGKTLYNKQPTSSRITDRKLGGNNGKFGCNPKSDSTVEINNYIKKSNPKNILLENVNPRNVLEIKVVSRAKGTFHPTQKPLELIEYLIKTYTNEKDIILDFTCGSGTTLLAAKKLKRFCYGVELEEKYCEITKNRLLQFEED